MELGCLGKGGGVPLAKTKILKRHLFNRGEWRVFSEYAGAMPTLQVTNEFLKPSGSLVVRDPKQD